MVKRLYTTVVCGLLALSPATAQLSSDDLKRLEELERKVRTLDPSFRPAGTSLDERFRVLESKVEELLSQKQSTPAITSVTPIQPVAVTGDYLASPETETRLPVAGYMDFHVNKDRGDPFKPDFHRFVLLFGHSFSSRIKLWSELELEHARVEGREEGGEVALEQAYLDFLIKPYFNLRAGMLLSPVGIINERHEPPSFNGVERPFVETLIIPTTWRELGFGFTGDLGRGFRYRAYVTSSLDASRFDAEQGITGGRTSGFDASLRNPAKVGRIEFAGVRRLTVGVSGYSGHAGFNTPSVNPGVSIIDFDARYSFRRLDFRSLFAQTWISRAAALNAVLQRQTGRNPNIARQMRGYYFEPAFQPSTSNNEERPRTLWPLRAIQHSTPHADGIFPPPAIRPHVMGYRHYLQAQCRRLNQVRLCFQPKRQLRCPHT